MIAKTITHTNSYADAKMSHCATICRHKKGMLIAYYEGRECLDEQHVRIEYWEKDKLKASICLPEKTGNCVLIPATNSKAVLICSYFMDTDGISRPNNPVQRWMFCMNWKIEISYKNGIQIGNFEELELDPKIGLLTRCQAIRGQQDVWFLPMYREHNCYGLIATSKDAWNWKIAGKIGESTNINGRFGSGILIQPTIWLDHLGYHTLSRDVSKGSRAWYSRSVDGMVWSVPEKTQVSNANNSLVAIQDGTTSPLIIWNQGMNRSKLCLGRWNPLGKTIKPIINLANPEKVYSLGAMVNRIHNSSYPNYAHDDDNNIHIIHSHNHKIMRHILCPETIRELEKLNNPSLTPEQVTWWTSE
jgi:hypothetical protein